VPFGDFIGIRTSSEKLANKNLVPEHSGKHEGGEALLAAEKVTQAFIEKSANEPVGRGTNQFRIGRHSLVEHSRKCGVVVRDGFEKRETKRGIGIDSGFWNEALRHERAAAGKQISDDKNCFDHGSSMKNENRTLPRCG